MPTAPAAPGLFARMTGCFRMRSSEEASGRPVRSAWPPGGNGLTIVMGRVGNGSSALAARVTTTITMTRAVLSDRIIALQAYLRILLQRREGGGQENLVLLRQQPVGSARRRPDALLPRLVPHLRARIEARVRPDMHEAVGRAEFDAPGEHDGRELHALGELRLPARRHIGERSEEHTSELQSHVNLVCRLLLEKKKSRPPAIRLNQNTKTKQLRR